MRIAAGIMMIIVGLTVQLLARPVAQTIGRQLASLPEADRLEIINDLSGWMGLSMSLLMGLTVGGGTCAFLKKHWGWALSGAICSVFIGFANALFIPLGFIFAPMGILSIIFVCRRKREWKRDERWSSTPMKVSPDPQNGETKRERDLNWPED